MVIPPEHQQLNSCFKFIRRCSTPEHVFIANEQKGDSFQSSYNDANNNVVTVSEAGCTNNSKKSTVATKVEGLHINTDPLRIMYTPSSRHHNQSSLDDIFFAELHFPQMKQPLTSPVSSNASSVVSSPILDEKCDATIHTSSGDHPSNSNTSYALLSSSSSPPPIVNRSPAASFLASFMSPATVASSPLSPTEGAEIIEDYRLGDSIGFGGFSTVRKAHSLHTRTVRAVKIIQQQLLNRVDMIRLNREIGIWENLDHPHIVRLRKVIDKGKTAALYLISDYCSGGNLLEYINKHKRLDEPHARRLFKELCEGIRYLHVDRRVCHKDLKLENILLDRHGHIKLCDFGLAIGMQPEDKAIAKEEGEEEMAGECVGGSLAYAAPEQIRHKLPLPFPKTDIWSLGIILYTLVVGRLPFRDTYGPRLQQEILKGRFDIPDSVKISVPLKELIYGCLTYYPESRLDINQVLQSKWLNNVSTSLSAVECKLE